MYFRSFLAIGKNENRRRFSIALVFYTVIIVNAKRLFCKSFVKDRNVRNMFANMSCLTLVVLFLRLQRTVPKYSKSVVVQGGMYTSYRSITRGVCLSVQTSQIPCWTAQERDVKVFTDFLPQAILLGVGSLSHCHWKFPTPIYLLSMKQYYKYSHLMGVIYV